MEGKFRNKRKIPLKYFFTTENKKNYNNFEKKYNSVSQTIWNFFEIHIYIYGNHGLQLSSFLPAKEFYQVNFCTDRRKKNSNIIL